MLCLSMQSCRAPVARSPEILVAYSPCMFPPPSVASQTAACPLRAGLVQCMRRGGVQYVRHLHTSSLGCTSCCKTHMPALPLDDRLTRCLDAAGCLQRLPNLWGQVAQLHDVCCRHRCARALSASRLSCQRRRGRLQMPTIASKPSASMPQAMAGSRSRLPDRQRLKL